MNKEKFIKIAEDIRDGNIPKEYTDEVKGDAKEYASLLLPNFTWNPPEPFWSNEYYFQWYRINDAGDLAAIQVAFFDPDCLAYCEEFEGPKWIQVAKTSDGYGEILDLDRIKERFDTYLNYATERTTHVDRKRADLVKRFKDASDEGMDELDFFLELIGNGVKLKDIWQCAPEYYEYSKKFMEEHGLI